MASNHIIVLTLLSANQMDGQYKLSKQKPFPTLKYLLTISCDILLPFVYKGTLFFIKYVGDILYNIFGHILFEHKRRQDYQDHVTFLYTCDIFRRVQGVFILLSVPYLQNRYYQVQTREYILIKNIFGQLCLLLPSQPLGISVSL